MIKPSQQKDLLARLNGCERQAISTELEIAVAAAFARNAPVKYEVPIGGKRPDLLVSPAEPGPEFLADIATVHDDDLHKKNPASYFFEEFFRFRAKHGLVNGGFDIRIGDRTTGQWPDKINRLLLPPKKDIHSLIKRELGPFLRAILSNPAASHRFERRDCEIDVRITYDPKQLSGSTGGYSGYNSAYSLERNPLFAKLDSKATQLHRTGYGGIKGIIVVDGGCQILRSTLRSGGTTWSCADIVERFLRRHDYIDFVTISYHEHEAHIFGNRRQRFRHSVFWQRPFDQAKIDTLHPFLNATFQSLPRPIDSPYNAVAIVRSGRSIECGYDFGWYRWTPNHRLAYSVRTLLPLIGGFMTNLEFKRLLNQRTPFRNPLFDFFVGVWKSDCKILDVQIERRPDCDDDVIVFDLAMRNERSHQESISEEAPCDIKTQTLVKYFVQLASEVIRPNQERFSIGALPIPIQQCVREHLRAGRLPTSASLSENGDTIRFGFDGPDAAISDFR